MGAYRDDRSGRWRYRKWVVLPNGIRERVTGTPATDTKKAAEHAEHMHVLRVLNPELVREPDVPATAKEVPTIAEYSVVFLMGYLPNQKPSARKSKEQILSGHLLPFFGHLRLDEIRQTDVDAFATAQLLRLAPKTVNNRLAVLRTLLKYAAQNQVIEPRKLHFHVRGESAEIDAVPAADVALLVRAAKDERYRVAILLASEAGLRIGEIRGLQWGDIEGNQITVRRAVDTRGNVTAPKHDKRRVIPLSVTLDAALKTSRRRGMWVVPTLEGAVLGYWTMRGALLDVYVLAKVDPPSMPWHSLRHTFGTELAGRNVPLPVVRDLMGHADIKTTMRYVTVADEQKRDAIALVFGQLAGNTTIAKDANGREPK